VPPNSVGNRSRADFAGRGPGNPVAPGAIPQGDLPTTTRWLGTSDTRSDHVDRAYLFAHPLNVGLVHIHTANVGAGHWMRLELAAAGYAVVRSYSLGMWTRDA